MEKRISKNRGDNRTFEQKLALDIIGKKRTPVKADIKVSDGKKSTERNPSGAEHTQKSAEGSMSISKPQLINTTQKSVNKPKKGDSKNNSESPDVSSDLLLPIKEVSKQHELSKKISTIELMMETSSKSRRIERLTSAIEQLGVGVEWHKDILKQTKLEIEQMKRENQMMRAVGTENKHFNQGRF